MRYTVLSRYELTNLINDVQEYIELGWIPQGGIASATWVDGWDIHQFRFLQAMIHPSDNPRIPDIGQPKPDV